MEQEEVSSVSSKSSIQWEPHFRLLGTLGGGIMESQNLELLTCDHWPRSAEGLLGAASCIIPRRSQRWARVRTAPVETNGAIGDV